MATEDQERDARNPYEGLKAYLDSLVEDYELHLVIKDFVGFLEGDKLLYESLKDYIIHKTSFCMAIKENHRLWKYCIYNKDLLYRKLQADPKIFIGQCYSGIVELVLPICHESKVIGAITVSYDKLDKKTMQKILDRLHHYFDTDTTLLYSLYKQSNWKGTLSKEALVGRLKILAEYIGLIYNPNSMPKLNINTKTPETYIMSHGLAYIQEHYKEDIRLESLARYCHCSASYMSHHFKEYTGVTLKTYVNKLRVEEGRTLLRDSEMPVTQIAYELGYKDSNYFSKVFKDLVGVSPLRYRQDRR